MIHVRWQEAAFGTEANFPDTHLPFLLTSMLFAKVHVEVEISDILL